MNEWMSLMEPVGGSSYNLYVDFSIRFFADSLVQSF